MPNIVASFDAGAPGKHLVLNGHIDVFPVADDGLGWKRDPWGGELIEGKIYGRGVAECQGIDAGQVGASVYPDRWVDVGTPERLAALNASGPVSAALH